MAEIFSFNKLKKNGALFGELFNIIQKYGSHSMAYSVLQPKMNYFFMKDVGLVAYAKFKLSSKHRYVLADIFCSPENLPIIAHVFLNKFPNTIFVQSSERLAQVLHTKFGFYSTPMGIETRIDLNNFDISSENKKNLRNSIRSCKGKLQFFEDSEKEINADVMRTISQDWMKSKKKGAKQLAFLARPLPLSKEIGVRRFYAFQNDIPVGFIIFNPIYFNELIVSYCADIIRTSSKAPRGTGDYLLYLALKKFKREGIQELSLGLSPLADLNLDKLNFHDIYTRRLLQTIYSWGEKLYHFKSLYMHKKQFGGKENYVYLCHKKRFPLFRILEIFRICNVL